MSVSRSNIEHMFDNAVVDLEPPAEEDAGLPLTGPLTTETGAIDVRKTLDWLADEPPGPWMLNLATLFASFPQSLMTPDERVDLLVLLERCESWTAAIKQQVLAGISSDAGEPSHRSEPGRFEDTLLEVAMNRGAGRTPGWDPIDRAGTGLHDRTSSAARCLRKSGTVT